MPKPGALLALDVIPEKKSKTTRQNNVRKSAVSTLPRYSIVRYRRGRELEPKVAKFNKALPQKEMHAH